MARSVAWNFATGETLTQSLVVPKTGMHGKISPAIGQLVMHGGTAVFTVVPDAGYAIASVEGCEGSLAGNLFTTGPIAEACQVTATFVRADTICGTPTSITVPTYDADGAYTVKWGASATAGVTYELQEATNSLFTSGLRSVYRGTATSAAITGRGQNFTYYYRVRAVKPGCRDSVYRTAGNGCRVGS